MSVASMSWTLPEMVLQQRILKKTMRILICKSILESAEYKFLSECLKNFYLKNIDISILILLRYFKRKSFADDQLYTFLERHTIIEYIYRPFSIMSRKVENFQHKKILYHLIEI